MAIITVSRQLGSQGDEIARHVAARLDYRLVDKQAIVEEGVRRGLLDAAVASQLGEGKLPLRERFDQQKARTLEAIRAIVRDTAEAGRVVIVGRGANFELRLLPGVLRVRIIAEFETRIQRIRSRHGVDRTAAARMINQSDKRRSGYVHYFFVADVADPEHYDVVINTTGVSSEQATVLIVDLAAAR